MAKKIPKVEFDQLARDKKFKEGPFIAGDEWAEPYQPHRSIRGVLLDGTVVESSTDPGWMQDEPPQPIDPLVATEESLRLLIANRGWANVLSGLSAVARGQLRESSEPVRGYYASLAFKLEGVLDWWLTGVINYGAINGRVRKALDPVMYAVVSRNKSKTKG